jgi:hypothetical protein
MKKILSTAIIALCSLAMSGCGGESHAVDDPHHDDYVPELRVFDLIDSYDTDTAKPNHPALALSPYLYDGLFDVFWQVNSLEDYTVTLRINDRPSLTNSLKIHSQVCGAGRRCDQGGNWICEYTNDFYMSCDGSSVERDIYPLVSKVPQLVYLLLEVCDSNSGYCEYDYYPVTLE